MDRKGRLASPVQFSVQFDSAERESQTAFLQPMRFPLIGRIGFLAYIRLSLQLVFAFFVLLTEPFVRLAFYLFPLKRLGDAFTSIFLVQVHPFAH